MEISRSRFRDKFLSEEFILAVNTLLLIAKEEGIYIDRTKLQKLLYLWHRACLRDEESAKLFNAKNVFSAWNYGPVIPEIMYYFKDRSVVFICGNNPDEFVGYAKEQQEPEDKKKIQHLYSVLDRYGNYSASYLTKITHLRGTPYDRTIMESGPYKPIKDEYIRNDGKIE